MHSCHVSMPFSLKMAFIKGVHLMHWSISQAGGGKCGFRVRLRAASLCETNSKLGLCPSYCFRGPAAACGALLHEAFFFFRIPKKFITGRHDEANQADPLIKAIANYSWWSAHPVLLWIQHIGAKCRIPNLQASYINTAEVEEQAEVQLAEGYTMTQFCDKMIEYFMKEKPQTKDWRKILVLRDEWNKYKESFYKRCQARADAETDSTQKQELIRLLRKVKRIDDEMESHTNLLKEIQENPTDLNAVVARHRKEFTGQFFRHLNVLSETYDSLEDRDSMARLGAKCLSAVSAYDNALEDLEMLSAAQSNFDDILSSPSLEAACEKIKDLSKEKKLYSSLVLLINKAWASAKESTTMKNEVKNIMYHLYKTTKSCIKSTAPKEIKLLKYLLNIIDPEERFSALATAFSPGNEREAKDVNVLYTTPKELHKWITIMLDAYHLNKEETDLREARQMSQPMVVQRLSILKETIEQEYMKNQTTKEVPETKESEDNMVL